jgi:hypothetical protein
MLDTGNGSQSNQGNQQGVLDQILAVLAIEEQLEAKVKAEKELIHWILRNI